jgi:hypothetical protein
MVRVVSPHTAGIVGVVPPTVPMASLPGAEVHEGEPSMDPVASPRTAAVGRVVQPTVPTASLLGAVAHTGEPSTDETESAPTPAVPPEELCMGPRGSPHGAAREALPSFPPVGAENVTTSNRVFQTTCKKPYSLSTLPSARRTTTRSTLSGDSSSSWSS